MNTFGGSSPDIAAISVSSRTAQAALLSRRVRLQVRRYAQGEVKKPLEQPATSLIECTGDDHVGATQSRALPSNADGVNPTGTHYGRLLISNHQ